MFPKGNRVGVKYAFIVEKWDAPPTEVKEWISSFFESVTYCLYEIACFSYDKLNSFFANFFNWYMDFKREMIYKMTQWRQDYSL